MGPKPLSIETVNNWFKYNPETGEFFARRIRTFQGKPTGEYTEYRKVGCVHVCTGYTTLRMGRGVNLRGARVAWILMTGKDPGRAAVDHINGIRNDDRWSNLRLATRQQNGFNRGPTKGRELPKGVYYEPYRDPKNKTRPRARSYRARIWVDDKAVSLGWYKTIEEAAAARKAGELKYFGEFNRK